MPTKMLHIPTADGQADAFAAFPDGGGRHPGVLMYSDGFGIRPVLREMARNLAGHGQVDVRDRAVRPPCGGLMVQRGLAGRAGVVEGDADKRRGAVSRGKRPPFVRGGAGQVGFSGVMPVPAYSSGSSDRTVSGSPAFTACQAIAAAWATGQSTLLQSIASTA
ncbi:hypothetical protein SAMN05442782_11035 [Streptomyces sp. OK228]|nr:hypothetical protein SAMN05442782_11035 [Streptomyces sp. OK228]